MSLQLNEENGGGGFFCDSPRYRRPNRQGPLWRHGAVLALYNITPLTLSYILQLNVIRRHSHVKVIHIRPVTSTAQHLRYN